MADWMSRLLLLPPRFFHGRGASVRVWHRLYHSDKHPAAPTPVINVTPHLPSNATLGGDRATVARNSHTIAHD